MVLVSPQEFQNFLQRCGSKYPYCEIFKTRTRFHVKWLVSNKPNAGTIPRQNGCYVAIPSNGLENDTVSYLIVTKQMLPVPPLMANILDWMDCWGRGKSVHWHAHVVDWIHFLLSQRMKMTDRIVLRDCVEYRVRELIREYAADFPDIYKHDIVSAFHGYFDNELINGKRDFFELAVSCSRFVLHLIEAYLNWIATTAEESDLGVVMSSD